MAFTPEVTFGPVAVGMVTDVAANAAPYRSIQVSGGGQSSFTVLGSTGTSYSPSLTVLSSVNTPYVVPVAVLSSNGTSYNTI